MFNSDIGLWVIIVGTILFAIGTFFATTTPHALFTPEWHKWNTINSIGAFVSICGMAIIVLGLYVILRGDF